MGTSLKVAISVKVIERILMMLSNPYIYIVAKNYCVTWKIREYANFVSTLLAL